MAVRRKITTNKFAPRSELTVGHTERADIERDITSSVQQGLFIKTGELIYIHNNTDNYLFAVRQYQSKLNDLKSQAIKAWKRDARALRTFIAKREMEFLSAIGIRTRKQFVKLVKETQTSLTDLKLMTATLEQHTKDIKYGIKPLGELRTLIGSLQRLSDMLEKPNCQFRPDLRNMPDTLKNRQEAYKEFIAANKHLPDKTIEVLQADLIKEQGVSIGSIINFVLPAIYEGFSIDIFRELIAGRMSAALDEQQSNTRDFQVFSTGAATMAPTTADFKVEINGAEFGVSVKSKQIRQTKDRLLDTFFNWQENLKNPTDGDIALKISNWQFFGSGFFKSGGDFVNLAKYIIMNFAYSNYQDNSILTELMSILAISGINEKIFGYNKTGDTSKTLVEILEQASIASINKDNEIIFTSEILENIISTIDEKLSTLYTFSLTHFGFTGEAETGGRMIRKQSASNRLNAAKTDYIFRQGRKDTTYAGLISDTKVVEALAEANVRLLKSIKIQINYLLNIKEAQPKEGNKST